MRTPRGTGGAAHQAYARAVARVEADVGNQTTDDRQLYAEGRRLLGRGFMGVYPSDALPPISPGRRARFLVANVDRHDQPGSHWLGVYTRGKSAYVYDSFGRSIHRLVPRIVDHLEAAGFTVRAAAPNRPEQSKHETDCGARSIAWLVLAKKSPRKAIQIAQDTPRASRHDRRV